MFKNTAALIVSGNDDKARENHPELIENTLILKKKSLEKGE
ncbi:MAG: hypothetical protein ACQEQS_08435 [Thermodesulfobacteriota bacterium]